MIAGNLRNKKRLLLMFYIGGKKYAIDAKTIKEIIPIVKIESIAEDSDNIFGYINYRGTMIPVIDLALKLTGNPSKKLLSTRIIIINTGSSLIDNTLIGMIAEKVTETKHIDDNEIKYPVLEENEKLLNGIIYENDVIVRCIKYDQLLPNTNSAGLTE